MSQTLYNYADDLTVWSCEEYVTTAAHWLQKTINKVKDWTAKWALTLNRFKTVATLFSLSNQKEIVRLQPNGEKKEISDKPTFLGVTLDPRLTWKPHLDTVEDKSIRRLSLVKKMAGTNLKDNLKILRQVYIGNVRPVAEYASSSWSTASKVNKTIIYKVQNMGLRIIHGAIKKHTRLANAANGEHSAS